MCHDTLTCAARMQEIDRSIPSLSETLVSLLPIYEKQKQILMSTVIGVENEVSRGGFLVTNILNNDLGREIRDQITCHFKSSLTPTIPPGGVSLSRAQVEYTYP